MKYKEIGPRGELASLASPLDPPMHMNKLMPDFVGIAF